jgi:AAA domain/Helix-turn-helix domain of resolvase
MTDIDFPQLMEPVARILLGEPNMALSKFPTDMRWGTHGSLSVNFADGIFFNHELGQGGGVIELLKLHEGCDTDGAMDWLKEKHLLNGSAQRLDPLPGTNKARKPVETYDYVEEGGQLLFQVVRYEPKKFSQRRPDGKGGWLWKLDQTRRVLYRLPEIIAAIQKHRHIFLVEGEKDADNLANLGFVATTCPGGANKWRDEFTRMLKGANVVVIPDNDVAGRQHVENIVSRLRGVAERLRVLDIAKIWPACPDKGDVSDWLAAGGDPQKLKELVSTLPDEVRQARLHPLSLSDFLALSIKPREMLLDPIIPEKGLAMLYASRGTGKTHIALGIAYAVASGTKFLKWSAPRVRRVLLIDGEMPGAALQDRLTQIAAGAQPDTLKILAGDLLEAGGIGNLGSPEVQAELDPLLGGIDLLILDNLSSLTAVIRDNDAESWGPLQEWLLRLRRRGLSVLIVHHAGKGGQQRGTSRREDVLDTSISLRHPEDYTPVEGARFEVHLEKARGIVGDAAKPFEARLEVRDGAAIWTLREIEDVNLTRVKAMLDDGMSIRDIADETGISKSGVHRLKLKAEAEGCVAGTARRDSVGTFGTPPTIEDFTVPLSQSLGTGTVGHSDEAADDLAIPDYLRRVDMNVCAQCHSGSEAPTIRVEHEGRAVLVHAECQQFWLKDHPLVAVK